MTFLWRAWDRFWFEPKPTRVLGLYRIMIGLITLYSFALLAKDVTFFFSDAGIFPSSIFHQVARSQSHIILSYIGSPWGVKCILIALFLVGISFTVGFKTRSSSILLFVLVASFHERNTMILNGGDTVLRCILFFFMFAPAGKSFSVDSLIKPQASSLHAPWAQRMMQIQVVVIYLVTAYAKTRGDLWHSGEAMYYIWGLVDFHIRGVEQLMNYPLLYSSMTFLVLLTEISLPYLLWFRASRPFAVFMGLCLHGWIMIFMTLPVFPILMMATYIPFFSDGELETVLEKVRKRFSPSRAKVYFDGNCPLCIRTNKIVSSFDLFHRLTFIDIRQNGNEEWPKGVNIEALAREMHLVTSKAVILTGFYSFRWIAVRLPATFWLAPFLYFPGVSFLGAKIYRWIAKNRVIAMQCSDSHSCSTNLEVGR